MPKKGDIIDYIPVDQENWKRATILGRAGKATGGNKYWLNIENNEDKKQFSIDWQNGVKEWKKVIQENAEEVFVIEKRHCEKKVK